MSKRAQAMVDRIDDENPTVYYQRVAEELERIANSVSRLSGIDSGLRSRLLAFAEQIRRDSDITGVPEGYEIN